MRFLAPLDTNLGSGGFVLQNIYPRVPSKFAQKRHRPVRGTAGFEDNQRTLLPVACWTILQMPVARFQWDHCQVT